MFDGARVSIEDRALQAMVMAALESYVIGNGEKPVANGRSPVENFGHLWGYHHRNRDGEHTYRVEVFDVSISAIRKRTSVKPNKNSACLKADFMRKWTPHLSLIGDFHTHPYESVEEVKSISGYEYSVGDRSALLHDDLLWEQSDEQPLMLIMTVCELQRIHLTAGKWERNNVYTFDVGQYRLWLTAAVGYLDENAERCVTDNKRSRVSLDIGGRYNDAERRIQFGA